jgi:hypothetical protein
MKMKMMKERHNDHKINNGNLVIRTIDKYDDSPAKSVDSTDKLNDDMIKSE